MLATYGWSFLWRKNGIHEVKTPRHSKLNKQKTKKWIESEEYMSDTLVVQSDSDRLPLKQYFGITESYDTGYGNDLDYINQWAQGKGLKNEDLLLELKKVEQRLGAPLPGENRYHRVKHYLSLDEKLTSTLKEMAAHERNWKEMI